MTKRERAAFQEAESIIEDLVCVACHVSDNVEGAPDLDSWALSTNAEAMRWLALRGRVKIVTEQGHRITANWTRTP